MYDDHSPRQLSNLLDLGDISEGEDTMVAAQPFQVQTVDPGEGQLGSVSLVWTLSLLPAEMEMPFLCLSLKKG
jgi:hypothetical protein